MTLLGSHPRASTVPVPVPVPVPQSRVAAPAAHAGPLRTVHTAAIAANVRRVTARGHDLVAVVKADGYGHGSATVARTALAAGAGSLGTATLTEALALRSAGIEARLLCWLHMPGTDFAAAARARVEVAVGDVATLTTVAAAGRRGGHPVTVHLHVDTGMAREGAEPHRWQALLAAAADAERAGQVRVTAVMGHVPNADLASTTRAVTLLRLAGLATDHAVGRPVALHLGGTPAAFVGADLGGIAVRVGAALVGIGPATAGLVGAMTVTAPVVAVRSVRAGTPVGYDGTWTAPADAELAVLPLGYADGIPRAASGSAQVRVRDRLVPVVGRVNMDQLVVDVTGSSVVPGELATVMGGPGPTAVDWARWAGTNAHEIVTGFGARVPRTVDTTTTTASTTRSTT